VPPTDPEISLLEIDSLTKTFGALTAVDDLSMHVRAGSMHGFVGANGAGKTTTMRMVVGIDAPDSGSVTIDGRAAGRATQGVVGYLPEERGLYPSMRVRDHLVYLGRLHGIAAADSRDRADRWLERLGLAERAGDAVEKLSLGNQQRVQLIAAMLHEPALLVLDEPFSGLDPIAVDVTAEVLAERVADGAAVLFSSHQLDLVERMCDEVTIIADGRIVAAGGVEQLRTAGPPRYVVRVEGAPPSWLDAVPGAVAEQQGADGQLVVRLPADAPDEQVLLDAARAAGRVRQFGPFVPTLAQLYREASR